MCNVKWKKNRVSSSNHLIIDLKHIFLSVITYREVWEIVVWLCVNIILLSNKPFHNFDFLQKCIPFLKNWFYTLHASYKSILLFNDIFSIICKLVKINYFICFFSFFHESSIYFILKHILVEICFDILGSQDYIVDDICENSILYGNRRIM